MNLKLTLGRVTWWIIGIAFVSACTLIVAPSVYRSRSEAKDVQAMAESVEGAEDALRQFRIEHEQLRAMQISELDEIINSDKSAQEMIDSAQKEKMDILRKLEIESTIAGILQARGFSDATVSAGDEYVNVMVRALQAKAEDVARILELVLSQTDVNAENIKIIPVN